jgi:hypothetical protein
VVLKPLEWICGKNLKEFEEACQQKPRMLSTEFNCSGESSQDQNAYRNVDSEGQAQEVQMGMRNILVIRLENVHVIFWQRICGHFFACPETSSEAEF